MPISTQTDFESIVRETQSHLRAYIAGLGVTGHDVDDVAQDVYIELYRNFERIPANISVERWLKGIARNLCMNFFRRTSRRGRLHRQALAEMLSRADQAESLTDLPGDVEAALAGCLKKLGAESRRLVLLRYEQELPSADIAARLDSTAEAIRVALHRIRAKLRQCINSHLAEQAPA
jgi:RNA polymerase sigma-70 factor (ECF subfamily)